MQYLYFDWVREESYDMKQWWSNNVEQCCFMWCDSVWLVQDMPRALQCSNLRRTWSSQNRKYAVPRWPSAGLLSCPVLETDPKGDFYYDRRGAGEGERATFVFYCVFMVQLGSGLATPGVKVLAQAGSGKQSVWWQLSIDTRGNICAGP